MTAGVCARRDSIRHALLVAVCGALSCSVCCRSRAAQAARLRSRRRRRRSRRAAAGGDRQARRSRLRHADQRLADRPADAGGAGRPGAARRRSPSMPTATSATARWCCSPASTIRAPRTPCASRWRARTIGCGPSPTASSSTIPIAAMVPELLAALEKEQAEFVRPALVRALAAHGDDPRVQQVLVREVGARRGLLPQRGDRGARRLQGAVRVRRAHRHRQARWPAAGRCGAGAGEDWRQARARDAGGAAAHRAAHAQPSIAAAICLLGVNCESHESYLDRDA